MSRNTNDEAETGRTGRCVPLSEDPDMIRLKELFQKLDSDRQAAFWDALNTEIEGEHDDILTDCDDPGNDET